MPSGAVYWWIPLTGREKICYVKKDFLNIMHKYDFFNSETAKRAAEARQRAVFGGQESFSRYSTVSFSRSTGSPMTFVSEPSMDSMMSSPCS